MICNCIVLRWAGFSALGGRGFLYRGSIGRDRSGVYREAFPISCDLAFTFPSSLQTSANAYIPVHERNAYSTPREGEEE